MVVCFTRSHTRSFELFHLFHKVFWIVLSVSQVPVATKMFVTTINVELGKQLLLVLLNIFKNTKEKLVVIYFTRSHKRSCELFRLLHKILWIVSQDLVATKMFVTTINVELGKQLLFILLREETPKKNVWSFVSQQHTQDLENCFVCFTRSHTIFWMVSFISQNHTRFCELFHLFHKIVRVLLWNK